MQIVVARMAFGATGQKRRHWIESVQRLNGGLPIDTEHDHMLRRDGADWKTAEETSLIDSGKAGNTCGGN